MTTFINDSVWHLTLKWPYLTLFSSVNYCVIYSSSLTSKYYYLWNGTTLLILILSLLKTSIVPLVKTLSMQYRRWARGSNFDGLTAFINTPWPTVQLKPHLLLFCLMRFSSIIICLLCCICTKSATIERSKNISLWNTNAPGDIPSAWDVSHLVTCITIDNA